MELSNELRLYIESHPEGLKLREIPDELLFEMLDNATKCEVERDERTVKGTDAFQQYFNLDMSYTTAYQEPKLRGYEKVWVKKNSKDADKIDVNLITGYSPKLAVNDFLVRENVLCEWNQFLEDFPEEIYIDAACNQLRHRLEDGGTVENWKELGDDLPSKEDIVSAALVLFMDMFKQEKISITFDVAN